MNWDNCGDWTTTSSASEVPRGIVQALFLEILAKFHRVYVVSALVDINELRNCTGLRNSFSGGNESVRHGNDNIPSFDPSSNQSKTQRVSSAADSHRVAGIAEFGESLFKLLYHWTTDEACAL